MNRETKIYVAGHRGMVGSAILENLKENGYSNFVTATSSELDLRNQQATNNFISKEKPDVVIIAAARVGGILANNEYPWPQPLKEGYLLTGSLEPTNQWYAMAKISGIKLCQALNQQYSRNYISIMPTNLYGPKDNFGLKTSHVLPAMIRKFYEAKENGHTSVPLWGTGAPMREFLHVDDLAESVRFVMEYNGKLEYDLINAGTGKDLTIKELAETVQEVVGHQGDINWDSSKPDGTPRKLMDVSRMSELGWDAKTGLEEGIRDTYQWFLDHLDEIKEIEIDG